MADYLIQGTNLTSIANEIRTLSDTTNSITISDMITNLQSANEEVATQNALLEEALTLLDNRTLTITESCTVQVTFTNFTDRQVVVIYSYLNSAQQIETGEMTFSAAGTYTITALKNCQIVFMGITGAAPSYYTFDGDVYSIRSFNYDMYYAYSFICDGSGTIDFVY